MVGIAYVYDKKVALMPKIRCVSNPAGGKVMGHKSPQEVGLGRSN